MNYDLINPRSLVDIIEPEGLNGDDQIKAQDVQIETIYLKNLISSLIEPLKNKYNSSLIIGHY